MQCLHDMGASVLPLSEALRRLHAKALPPRSVVITFDDGFYDFYIHAKPVLAELQFPCTLYLTTHYCRYRLPVITLVLDYLLWKSGLKTADFPQFGIAGRSLATYEERQEVVRGILAWMDSQNLTTIEKNDIAGGIASDLGVDYGSILRKRMLQIVSHEEAVELSRSGIDLQLHTHRHRTPCDAELFRREILDNSNAIVDLTGTRPSHFCYPSGHYLPQFLPWLSSLNIESATTCKKGLAGPDSGDLTLPRVLDDATMTPVRFQSLVAGLLA
jgi:peptidoglycan/xylan/chitin deacetylase (PgdA/CDA1 family)